MAKAMIKTSKGWKEVCSGTYEFCRQESAKWIAKGYETDIVTKTPKSTHRYKAKLKERMAKNYNQDLVSLHQRY